MALEKACSRINRECTVKRTLKLRRVAFFDHSDLCNHVFQYNFGCNNQNALKSSSVSKKIKLTAIEKLTLSQLEGQFKASIWTMSPPCQPHTRQHSHQDRDIQDPRSQSFLHLCSIIEHMAEDCLPKLIFIENVIGFEQVNFSYHWSVYDSFIHLSSNMFYLLVR
jgi:tRNA (cytosine38-C5)-methyltransferase